MTRQEYLENYHNIEKCQVYRNYVSGVRSKREALKKSKFNSEHFPIVEIHCDKDGVDIVWRTPTSYEFDKSFNFTPPSEIKWALDEFRQRNNLEIANRQISKKQLMIAVG